MAISWRFQIAAIAILRFWDPSFCASFFPSEKKGKTLKKQGLQKKQGLGFSGFQNGISRTLRCAFGFRGFGALWGDRAIATVALLQLPFPVPRAKPTVALPQRKLICFISPGRTHKGTPHKFFGGIRGQNLKGSIQRAILGHKKFVVFKFCSQKAFREIALYYVKLR